MKEKLRALYAAALAIEPELPAYIEKLEQQRDRLQERVDNYDFKDYLTERQEDLRDEAESKVSDLEEELETLEELESHLYEITGDVFWTGFYGGQFPDLDAIKKRRTEEFLAKYEKK